MAAIPEHQQPVGLGYPPLGAARLAADTSSAAMKNSRTYLPAASPVLASSCPPASSSPRNGAAVQKALERKFKASTTPTASP